MIGRLLDLSRKDARRRADEMLERFSLTEAAKKAAMHYSGGMRRPARPRGLADRQPGRDLPGRADHRSRPAHPQRGVGRGPAPGRRGRHRAADDPVHGGGRAARQRADGHRPRQGHRQGQGRRAEGARRRAHPEDPPRVLLGPAGHGPLAGRGRTGRRGKHPGRARRGRPAGPDPERRAADRRGRSAGRPGYAIADLGTYLPSLDEVFLAITGQKPSAVEDSVPTEQTEEVAA